MVRIISILIIYLLFVEIYNIFLINSTKKLIKKSSLSQKEKISIRIKLNFIKKSDILSSDDLHLISVIQKKLMLSDSLSDEERDITNHFLSIYIYHSLIPHIVPKNIRYSKYVIKYY